MTMQLFFSPAPLSPKFWRNSPDLRSFGEFPSNSSQFGGKQKHCRPRAIPKLMRKRQEEWHDWRRKNLMIHEPEGCCTTCWTPAHRVGHPYMSETGSLSSEGEPFYLFGWEHYYKKSGHPPPKKTIKIHNKELNTFETIHHNEL